MNRLRKAAGYNVVRESPVDEVQTNGDFPWITWMNEKWTFIENLFEINHSNWNI
jgi:hypothetical protein